MDTTAKGDLVLRFSIDIESIRVIKCPLIAIGRPDNRSTVDEALDEELVARAVDDVIFTGLRPRTPR